MNPLKHLGILFLILIAFSCKNKSEVEQDKASTDTSVLQDKSITDMLKVIPITHGTLVLDNGDQTIYIDPTGGAEAFKNQKAPTMVLITDIHGDHLSLKTLEALNLENVPVIVPQAVADKLPSSVVDTPIVINNGETNAINGITIEAIPMYNLREEALKFHEKGRGNGYILTINDERIYISGDTEDIPEMRTLKNINKAFVCMNLPYTMPVESAASAVLDFKPDEVYPYHYRGTNGFSDINTFKSIVEGKDNTIKVTLLKWY